MLLFFLPKLEYAVLSPLYARGYFNKKGKLKTIIVVIIYLSLIFLTLFFVKAYITDLFEAITTNKKLDIKKYPDLKKRDAEWLAAIIQKTKIVCWRQTRFSKQVF